MEKKPLTFEMHLIEGRDYLKVYQEFFKLMKMAGLVDEEGKATCTFDVKLVKTQE